MINMDMVGRLDTTNALAINGTGVRPHGRGSNPRSIPPRQSLRAKKPTRDSNAPPPLRIKTTDSGVGPSHQTSFGPARHPRDTSSPARTRTTTKPSDDEEKINYDGMVRVLRTSKTGIGALDKEPKLAFTKTAADSSEVPQFKVTMGVVPDYMYDGKGHASMA